MKKSISFILLAIMLSLFTYAEQPKCEFRATWLATVQNIDWPKTTVTSNTTREQQKKEFTDILDKMVAGNMNAICMQVRSLCDAMYQSSYEPWSVALTGTRGKDPGYDPLQFAIDEAHKRGIELHVWVNPFRVTSSGTLDSSDQLWQHAGDWIIKYNNGSFKGQIIDPGYPEARQYVINVLMEIVNNYDIDGILMDDYFYPYGGTTTEDADSKTKYKPNNVLDVNKDGDTDDDWRRANVDSCMKMLYDTIQVVKPWVRFGMGPFGIWSTQKKAAEAYGITLPSGISGLDDYDVQACNTVEWVKQGWVDYINPQLYWSTNIAAQDYNVLCKWWAKDVCEHFSNQLPDGKKVHFFISQAAYHAYDGYKGYDAGVAEVQKQIDVNRNNLSSGYTGSVFYNTTAYCKMYDQLAQSHFQSPALPPAMDWKVKTTLEAPTNITLSGGTLSWEHPTAERFTIYAFPIGTDIEVALDNPAYLQGIVWGKSMNISHISDITKTTIAVVTYDRFGVEHGVAVYTPTPDITWELNGGQLPKVEVPTNQELWNMFKADFDEFYSAIYPNYQIQEYPIHAVLELTWPKWSNNCFATEFITGHPDWIWLGEYIQSIYGKITDVKIWRYNLYAFFNASDEVRYESGQVINVSCGDFTTAGRPEAWGSAYLAAKGAITLPLFVDAEYTLPNNLIHPEGYPFLGWWDNATFIGAQLYTIPAYWKGTLYANWKQPSTDIENIIDTTQPMQIFDLMGRRISTSIELLQGNIFIIKQGDNVLKIIK